MVTQHPASCWLLRVGSVGEGAEATTPRPSTRATRPAATLPCRAQGVSHLVGIPAAAHAREDDDPVEMTTRVTGPAAPITADALIGVVQIS
jgi:hypothetical protein